MRKIEWYCDTEFGACRLEGSFEVANDYTVEDITDYVLGEILN